LSTANQSLRRQKMRQSKETNVAYSIDLERVAIVAVFAFVTAIVLGAF